MSKSPDAFRTISEVAEWLGVQAHVLRFWESKFSQVKPVKRAGGRRYYRPADMKLLGGIRQLLHEDGMTIKGVQKLLREQGVGHVSDMSAPLDGAEEDSAPSDPVLHFRSRMPRAGAEPVEAADPAASDVPAAIAEDPEKGAPEPVPAAEPPAMAEEEAEVPPKQSAAPNLPSFMSRAAPPAEPEHPTEPPAKTPLVVDAPDPPAEAEIAIAPGPLTHLTRLAALSPARAAEIAPLARELRAHLGQSQGGGVA